MIYILRLISGSSSVFDDDEEHAAKQHNADIINNFFIRTNIYDKKENGGIFLTAIHHSDFADPIYLQYSFCTIAKVID